MQFRSLALYARTIPALKPSQIAYQLIRRFSPNVVIPPVVATVFLRDDISLAPIVRRAATGEDTSFNFLNVPRVFDQGRFDWDAPDMGKLWRYNLHYFDYLHEEQRTPETKAFLINDWITQNPQGMQDAWEPFPASLRIVNWIKYFLRPEIRATVRLEWLRSLYHQALWLEKNIESHLLANHYFKNCKALVFAGMFFTGTDAERWLKKGLKILSAEIDEQVLPDGGHFERSPMYHSMILEDCLDLLNLGLGTVDSGLVVRLTEKCRLMLRFLGGMIHPDGEIALFNDAAFGIEPTYAELAEYFERVTGEKAKAPDAPCWSFPDTGYFVMSPHPGDRLIIDCGPVGPDYQPGHAHSDTLSFELSLQGRRVIVDSGCCQYLDGDIRRYNRGNVGHNTVTIDNENQSEVWGAHRCARRARPLYGRLENRADGTLTFAGAHDGYRRLAGKPIHHRSITWSCETCLIEDRVEGGGSHDLESRLHIHPALSVEIAEGSAVIRDGLEHLATISSLGIARIETTDGWYCPEFGVQQPCTVIVTRFSMAALPFNCGWIIKTGN